MANSWARKIVDQQQLCRVAEAARAAGKTVVHCHGCFDIVHPGHLRYLEFARRQGDILIVSVTGDRLIDKGNQRPFIPEELRAENLAALEIVDWVHVNSHPTAVELLRDVRPHVYVKGREYERSSDAGFLTERQAVEAYGGRVVFSSGEVVFSSTQLLAAMDGQHEDLEAQRLRTLCRRHRILNATLEHILDRTGRLRIVVVGDTVLDRYVMCDAANIAGEAPILSLVELEHRDSLGGAAIIARHAAALGADATLITAKGRDSASDFLTTALGQAHVETVCLETHRALPIKRRYLVEDTKILRVEKAAFAPLDSQTEAEAFTQLERRIDDADAVIWCDFGYGMVTSGLLRRALPMLRKKGKIVTANVSGPRSNLLAFREVDLITPTERELRAALHNFEHGLSKVAWEAMSATKARHLLVTLGKGGVVVFDRQTQDPSRSEYAGRLVSEHLPALATGGRDALGCSDAFLATVTVGLASNAELMQAAYLGAAAAAIELGRLGNVPVSRADLYRWLESRAELIAQPEAVRRRPPRRPVRIRAIHAPTSAVARSAESIERLTNRLEQVAPGDG
jgi:rfaE bifunctional protein kinase chain/domain/rfaE bifunctional protein nucleotidyltransferase chain/domain